MMRLFAKKPPPSSPPAGDLAVVKRRLSAVESRLSMLTTQVRLIERKP